MEPGEDINWLAQVRRGVAEHCVLALLTKGEWYGFELARELGARGQIIASEGTLYPLLARLRRNGLVETSWRESDAGPPPRRALAAADQPDEDASSATLPWPDQPSFHQLSTRSARRVFQRLDMPTPPSRSK
jgi:hypothetical protein